MPSTYTVCFCGTDCWTDQGLPGGTARGGSTPAGYGTAGYIPVKAHSEIQGPNKTVVPGPGAPYVQDQRMLWVPSTVSSSMQSLDTGLGLSMWDLAGHAAAKVVGTVSEGRGPDHLEDLENERVRAELLAIKEAIGAHLLPGSGLKPPSHERYQFRPAQLELLLDSADANLRDGKIMTINLIGHSRGAVEAIMCSHELAYLFPDATVNIFAIDPVPGPGPLKTEMMTLGPTVGTYVGVYALDEVSNGFNAVAPWPKYQGQYIDPLDTVGSQSDQITVPNYHLIYAPGRHGTVAGAKTRNGDSDENMLSDEAAQVGIFVDYLARSFLRQWGTNIPASQARLGDLRPAMTEHAAIYRNMRATVYPRTGDVTYHWRERGITSSEGSNPSAWSYLEDAIGNAPLVDRGSHLTPRPGPGRVRWVAIQDFAIP